MMPGRRLSETPLINSITLMRQRSIIEKTPDGLYIAVEHLHLVEGWDSGYDKIELLDACHDLAKRLILDEEARTLRDFTAILEPIQVYPRDPEGVWVVKGHRHVRTYLLLQGLGFKLPAIRIIPFKGTAVQRNVNMNSDKDFDQLEVLEQAIRVLDMVDRQSMTVAEIARDLNVKRQVIEQLLQLARAPGDLHEQVRLGHIRPFTAIQAIKLFDDKAAQVIARLYAENGGKRVLPRHLKDASGEGRASSAVPRMQGLDSILGLTPVADDGQAAEAAELLQRFRKGEDLLGDLPVQLNVRALNALLSAALASKATPAPTRAAGKPRKGSR